MVGGAVRLLVQVAESLKSHMGERLAKDKEQTAFPTEVAAGHHTQACQCGAEGAASQLPADQSQRSSLLSFRRGPCPRFWAAASRMAAFNRVCTEDGCRQLN